MSRTYTLNSTSMAVGAVGSWTDADWHGYTQRPDQSVMQVGRISNGICATNILFDPTMLAFLRTKNVISIRLTLTITWGTIQKNGSTGYVIGYKLNGEDGINYNTGNNAWTRSDADSNAASTTAAVGYITSQSDAQISVSSPVTLTYDLIGKVPKYGYSLGNAYLLTSHLNLASSATLTVVTDETLALYYNANGGTGAPATQTMNGTPDATFRVSSTIPTRTGYTFVWWNSAPDGSGWSCNANWDITLSSSVTLYAIWNPVTYNVSFNANGGSGAPSAQTKTYGVTLTLSSTIPTKTGYNFLGWAESASATAAAYSAGGSFTKNADTVLYAVWSANQYSVVYYGNASDATNVPAAQTKTYGINLTLTASKPSRTGYTFSKWNTAANGTGTDYAPGATYTGNAGLSLYAIWTINTYTVSYNANGGTGAPASQTKTYNVNLTLSSTVPTRSGYNFLGWSESNTATVATYSAGGTFTKNENKTLYAVWELKTYTITYNANGGTGAPAAQTKTHGVDITLEWGIPFRSGYTFYGWDTDSSATTATYQPGDTFSTDADTILYAIWRKNYVVRYYDGGTQIFLPQIKIHDVALVLRDEVPTKESYTFDYWESGGNQYDPGDIYTANADLTLTAHWTLLALTGYCWYVVENGVPVRHYESVVEDGQVVQHSTYVK